MVQAVRQATDRHLDRKQRAALAPHHALEQSVLDLAKVREAPREQRFLLLGIGVHGAEPQQRILAVAQHFAEPGIDEFEVALRVRDEDAIRGLLDELAELGLALAHSLLGAPALRDFDLQLRRVALDDVVEDGVFVEHRELGGHHRREALVFLSESALAALVGEVKPAVHPLLGGDRNSEKIAHQWMVGREFVRAHPCIGALPASLAMSRKKRAQHPLAAAICIPVDARLDAFGIDES